MATSQFYSVCLAHERIRACRAFLLASPCRLCRAFLHTTDIPISQLSFHSSFGYSFNGGTGPFFACRALSSIGSSSRSRKPAPASKNPREEIRQLDEEIRRLEKERRSVGKENKTAMSNVGGKKGNAGYGNDAVSRVKHAQGPPIGRNAKFAASAGSSRTANARALARYEQEEAEEEDDDLEDDDDEEDDDDVLDKDDEELGEDFSSDAEMYMEASEEEEQPKVETLTSASSTLKEPSSDSAENPEESQAESGDPTVEASAVNDVYNEGVHNSIKHPWKEWNDFYDVLALKNYFKDVPPKTSPMEGEGYLRFQASAHMKRAILEFSRERDDIIRFLTKKHIKTVVMVGCPSTDRKVVNACKRLRVLCEIPEDEVCQQCKLKTFCTRAFAAPSPDLMAETVDVTRVLYSFALNASPIAESQVSYPIGVVKSACHLVDEIVQLSAYPKDPGLPALKSRLPVKQPVSERHDTESNHRPGDWTCPDCNFLNFAKNHECRECGTRRGSGKQLEPGDWECPECTFVNFRRNHKCRECLTARPEGAGGNETLMPGDWKCPECQFVNFRRNSECHKCSTRRPKGMNVYDGEELEPGDWKCPECNFRNFKRNKNCKECGALSPDQGQKDDRWGLKKSSGGGWGSSSSLPSMSTDTGASSGRAKHQEWKPDLSRNASDDSDDDLEEDADVVFGLDGDKDDENLPRSSQALEKGTKSKAGTSQRKVADELSLSDFDFSDLDDLPKELSKKSGGRDKNSKVVGDDEEEQEEDDDNDMEDELSADEKSMQQGASKQGRGVSGRWDDSASDASEDDLPPSRAALKHKPARGRGVPRNWDDSDDDDDGFSDDGDDDFGGGKSRIASRGGRNGGNFGSRGGERGARFGYSRGGRRGESNSRGAFGGRSSNFSESNDNGNFRRGSSRGSFGNSRGGRRGESNSRGAFGGRSSNFSESDDDGDFRRGSSRGSFGNSRGGRRGESNGRGGFGGRSSTFSESDDDGDFRRGSSRGSFRGNGRGRGGGGSFRGNFGGRGGGGSSRGGGRGFRGGRGGRGRS